MSVFEENDVSKNAFGGTELAKRRLNKYIDPELLDNFQIICSRPREFNQDKIRVFWAHDLPQDPESKQFKDQSFLNNLHKFVFVSNWQYNQYQLHHQLPYDIKAITIDHGIVPLPNARMNRLKAEDGKLRIVYTSTPQRGLDILLPVFEKLAVKYPFIHLDVFSSFKIYGWDEADKQFELLYERCRNHPQITYHGFVSNDILREHLTKSHIFAYPSIWLETACLSLIEAMSAGLVCVHPNYGALPETSGSLNMMYQGDQNRNIHANIFMETLENAINLRINWVSNIDSNIEYVEFNKKYVDSRFNIDKVAKQWTSMLKELLIKYPTPESRKKPPAMFVYKT
jgi:glycosyltransferase involved in cell wall biosynthesis